MPYRKNGFTLIELLVTITIIAILAAIGLVTYSMALKQGRDSKRQSDLRAIQSALEQYNSDQLFYPANPSMNNLLSTGGLFTSSIGNPVPPSPVKTYLNSVPQDPTSPTGLTRYRYSAIPAAPAACDNSTTNRCTSYCLYAKLENLASPVPLPFSCGATYPAGGYNFVVTLP